MTASLSSKSKGTMKISPSYSKYLERGKVPGLLSPRRGQKRLDYRSYPLRTKRASRRKQEAQQWGAPCMCQSNYRHYLGTGTIGNRVYSCAKRFPRRYQGQWHYSCTIGARPPLYLRAAQLDAPPKTTWRKSLGSERASARRGHRPALFYC